MIWLLLAGLAMAALVPLASTLSGRRAMRGAREMAVTLYRAQLVELDRDRSEGRIPPTEHATATLEVQRRLLAAAGSEDAILHAGGRLPVLTALCCIPAAALALYLVGGHPSLPSVPSGSPEASRVREAILIEQLREQLGAMDPDSDRTRQGYVLLGNAEESRGRDAEAAAAWRRALRTRFDPTLAARTADAELRAKGAMDAGIADLFRRALAAAPDAPWRAAVEARLLPGGF